MQSPGRDGHTSRYGASVVVILYETNDGTSHYTTPAYEIQLASGEMLAVLNEAEIERPKKTKRKRA